MYTLRIEMYPGVFHNVNLGESYTKVDVEKFMSSPVENNPNDFEELITICSTSADEQLPCSSILIFKEPRGDKHGELVCVCEIIGGIEDTPVKRNLKCYIVNDNGNTVDAFTVSPYYQ